MNYKKWLNINTQNLKNKVIILTGSTGGLGNEIANFLGGLNANITYSNNNVEAVDDGRVAYDASMFIIRSGNSKLSENYAVSTIFAVGNAVDSAKSDLISNTMDFEAISYITREQIENVTTYSTLEISRTRYYGDYLVIDAGSNQIIDQELFV